MEPLFEVQSAMTESLYRKFYKVHLRRNDIRKVIVYVMGLAMMLEAVGMLLYRSWLFMGVLLLLAGLCFVYPSIPNIGLHGF